MPIQDLARHLLPAAGLALALGTAMPAAAQMRSDRMADFMVMDVCVDRQDKILTDLAPGDAGCDRRRNIRAGEPIPYHLHNYPARNTPCQARLGTVSKDNVPIEKNGVTRIVSFYDKGVDHSCPDVSPDAPRFGEVDAGREGGSVQWVDDQWAYTMGSWSPVALSYWLTPACEETPDTSGRFRYGWVTAPAALPPRGSGGHAVFESKLVAVKGGSTLSEGCPKRYNKPLTVWLRDDFTYKSGHDMDSVISMRFSSSDRDGDGPGKATQVEITYWTKEFGLTRWEKWARQDWVHPRSGKEVAVLGDTLAEGDSCSPPYVFQAAPAPRLSIEAKETGGKFGRTITDPKTGESHDWYMSLCSDYTNIVKDPAGGLVPPWGQAISDIFWVE